MLVLLALFLVRRLARRKKELNATQDNRGAQAHDNPTYMTAAVGLPPPLEDEPPYETLGAIGGDITPYSSIRSKKSITPSIVSDVIIDK